MDPRINKKKHARFSRKTRQLLSRQARRSPFITPLHSMPTPYSARMLSFSPITATSRQLLSQNIPFFFATRAYYLVVSNAPSQPLRKPRQLLYQNHSQPLANCFLKIRKPLALKHASFSTQKQPRTHAEEPVPKQSGKQNQNQSANQSKIRTKNRTKSSPTNGPKTTQPNSVPHTEQHQSRSPGSGGRLSKRCDPRSMDDTSLCNARNAEKRLHTTACVSALPLLSYDPPAPSPPPPPPAPRAARVPPPPPTPLLLSLPLCSRRGLDDETPLGRRVTTLNSKNAEPKLSGRGIARQSG